MIVLVGPPGNSVSSFRNTFGEETTPPGGDSKTFLSRLNVARRDEIACCVVFKVTITVWSLLISTLIALLRPWTRERFTSLTAAQTSSSFNENKVKI